MQLVELNHYGNLECGAIGPYPTLLHNLVHRAGFEPALETRPSGHSLISGWTNLHSIILTAHKLGGGGEIRTLFILPYEDNVLPIILLHHIETHCCGRRIPSDVVSRDQTFSIYTVLSAMYFNMANSL